MKPLSGVRILTVEQFGAGPYGSMFLAVLGAEVIKIENAAVGGDPSRHGGPFPLGENDSLYYQGWNTNKKSVTLDLKTPEGQAALHRLAATSDAVMNNLRGDQPAKLGLDYKSLRAVNKKLVCGHVSAYGRDNDRARRPGYDFLMQAEAGLMSLTGEPGAPPTRFGPSIIDYMSGITLAVGLLSCILRARSTGEGCDVDTCLFDVALHQLSYSGTWFLNRGHAVERLPRSSHFSTIPSQTFKAADGWIFIMCMSDKFWELLVTALDRKDLLTDVRFQTNALRRANIDALTKALDEVFETQTMAYWVEKLGSQVPIGPVYELDEALQNPFVQQTGMIENVPHPQMQDMRLLGFPIKIDGERPKLNAAGPLGRENDELLK